MRSVKADAYSGESRSPGGRRGWTSAYAGVLLALAVPAHAAEPTPYQQAIAAGYKALTICSAMFNAETAGAKRSLESIERNELTGIYPEYDQLIRDLPVKVDRDRSGRVLVTYDVRMPPRVAVHKLWAGCTVLPIGTPSDTGADAVVIKTDGPRPRGWPFDDTGRAPRMIGSLQPVAERAFEEQYGTRSNTTAVLIVRDGRIVAERYAPGFGVFTPQRTWSVAKSMAGTLVGAAVKAGYIDVQAPAPVPEWQRAGDPRTKITMDNLLRMASGLHSDTAGNRTDAIYFGGTAVTEKAVAWPLERLPGTRFRYANDDILLASRALMTRVPDNIENYPSHVLGSIGLDHTFFETDWQGNFILSSQVWSTARDLARLGLLWLNDGVWNGERILPEGWVKYMTTPSGPQPESGPGYGATMWLFGPKQGLPEGSYAAQGNRGQYIMVIPSERLVIVRRGEDPVGAPFDIAQFSADVAAALK